MIPGTAGREGGAGGGPGKVKRKPASLFKLSLGWFLTVSGLIMMPFPIVPGFLIVLPGLALLASESRFIRRHLRRYRTQRLVRRAIREAERAGIKIDLDEDEDDDPPGEGRPPASNASSPAA